MGRKEEKSLAGQLDNGNVEFALLWSLIRWPPAHYIHGQGCAVFVIHHAAYHSGPVIATRFRCKAKVLKLQNASA